MRLPMKCLSLFLLALAFADGAYARGIRLFDQTGNDNWIIELDLNPRTQQSFSARARDAKGLPPEITLTSTLYMAEWGRYTPGVPFQEQAKTNKSVFQCQLSATEANYKIVRNADGTFGCQVGQLRAIPRLTVKMSGPSKNLAALVDYKPVSLNQGDQAVIAANALDNRIKVTDWQQTMSRHCPVENDTVTIVINSFTSVECGTVAPPPVEEFAKLNMRLSPDVGGVLPEQTDTITATISYGAGSSKNREVSLRWSEAQVVERLPVGQVTVMIDKFTTSDGRVFLPLFTPSNSVNLIKDQTAEVNVSFKEQMSAREDIHVSLGSSPFAGTPASLSVQLWEGTTLLETKTLVWGGNLDFTQKLTGKSYRLVSPTLQSGGVNYAPVFHRNDRTGAVFTEFTLTEGEAFQAYIDYPVPTTTKDRKVIGYYESWSQWRTNLDSGYKSALTPPEINPNIFTHIVFAFGSFGFEIFDRDSSGRATLKRPHNTGDYRIKPWEDNDNERLAELVALKQANPKLKIIYALGGWNFNLPASAATNNPYIYSNLTNYLFSDMISNTTKAHKQPVAAGDRVVPCTGLVNPGSDCVELRDDSGNPTTSRKQFIDSLLKFLRARNIDGVDLDWEYPGSLGRGGLCEDFTRYGTLVKELRAAIDAEALASGRPKLSLSMAVSADVPGTTCPAYANDEAYFAELAKWSQSVDWMGMMSYDFYGNWGPEVAPNAPLNPVIDPTTGREIIAGFNVVDTMKRYVAAGISKDKIMVGMAAYGRNFSDVQFGAPGSNYGPGLRATGSGFPGESTGEAGLSTYFEILDLVSRHGFQQGYDQGSQTPYIYNTSLRQWVGFDNKQSLTAKCRSIIEQDMAGTIVWAITNDDHQGVSGERFPLVSTIYNCLRSPSAE